jgi:predicted amidohydrolase
MIREAAAGGARIIITTECFLDGYAVRDKTMPVPNYHALAEPVPEGEYVAKIADLARELDVYLVTGLHTVDGRAHHNSAVLFDPHGEVAGIYHKHRLGHEVDRHVPGARTPVFATHYGTLGLMICADRGEPTVCSALASAGADVVVCVSGGAFGPDRNDEVLRQRSRETRKHIIFVHPAEVLVTAPDGSILDMQLFGDPAERDAALAIGEEEIGGERDWNQVCYVDLPIPRTP